MLQEIQDFADWWHGDQLRRYTKERYIVHPVRVMERCKLYTGDTAVLAAALLHDVLEDTPLTKVRLAAFLQKRMSAEEAAKTVRLVEELTDVYTSENYPKWNRKKRKLMEAERLAQTSSEAQTVKYADIMDNAPEIAEKDPDFAKTFLPEYKALLKRITNGNPDLYRLAQVTLQECMTRK